MYLLYMYPVCFDFFLQRYCYCKNRQFYNRICMLLKNLVCNNVYNYFNFVILKTIYTEIETHHVRYCLRYRVKQKVFFSEHLKPVKMVGQFIDDRQIFRIDKFY